MIRLREATRADVPAVVALPADAEAQARGAGCRLIQLTANKTRAGAQRFWQRPGFTPSHIGDKRDLS